MIERPHWASGAFNMALGWLQEFAIRAGLQSISVTVRADGRVEFDLSNANRNRKSLGFVRADLDLDSADPQPNQALHAHSKHWGGR